jgi:uncharacterized protein (TIRG00374 family)
LGNDSRPIDAPDNSGSRPRNLILLAGSICFSAFLLYRAFQGVQWGEIAEVLSRCSLVWLLAAMVLFLLTFIVRSERWSTILVHAKPRPVLTVFFGTMTGMLGNYYLPARGGELLRCVLLGRVLRLSKHFVLATIVVERLFDVLSSTIMAGVSISLLGDIIPSLRQVVIIASSFAGLGVVLLFIAVRNTHVVRRLIQGFPLPSRWSQLIRDIAERFLLGLISIGNPKRLLIFTAWTACFWLVDVLGLHVLGLAFGMSIPLSLASLILVCLGFASILPSAPGFVGVYQIVLVQVMVPFGYTAGEALAYSIALHAVNYLIITVFGLVGLGRLGRLAARLPGGQGASRC